MVNEEIFADIIVFICRSLWGIPGSLDKDPIQTFKVTAYLQSKVSFFFVKEINFEL